MAQYYPAPQPIDPRRETKLLLELKNTKPDLGRVRVQLQLCNLYFNKPFKRKADLEKAMQYAREASAGSANLHDSAGFNDAQLFIADILAERNDMKATEEILPLVNDTAKINLLLTLSYKYRLRGGDTKAADQEKALDLAQQARELSIHLHQPEKEILALLNIADAHADQRKTNAKQELLEVIEKYRSIGFRNLHYVYYRLSQLELKAGDHDKAIFYSLEAIKSMKATGDTLAAGDFYVWHAHVCREINEFQKCLDYSRLAIQSYTVHAGEFDLPSAAFVHTFGLRKMKRFSEAVEFVKQIAKKYPPENVAADISYNMTIGNIYADTKQFAKAEPYLLRAYELNKPHNVAQVSLDRDLGHLYIESHQYEKARPYLNRALKIPQATFAFLSYTHYLLYLVDSAAGNFRAAIEHLHRNHTLVDSSLAESKQRDIQKLLIQFESKEKEDKIRIKDQNIALLNQKATLQQVELSRTNLIKNITIGSVFFLLVISFLLYLQYRSKKRSNQIILQKNEALQQLVTEKEWLLKEDHHRVKNNLHTVICLLESQAAYLENDALKAIEKSQHRIYAMSLIHQKLYQSEDIKTIDMKKYLPEFIQYLSDSFDTSNQIRFQLDIEPLKLSVAQAIPIALIINEAVTNSIKYAFPYNRKGEISIAIYQIGNQMKLEVADNGIGMNPNLKGTELNSLGLELMKGLSEEIRGHIEFENNKGTKISVTFKMDTLMEFENHLLMPLEKEVYT